MYIDLSIVKSYARLENGNFNSRVLRSYDLRVSMSVLPDEQLYCNCKLCVFSWNLHFGPNINVSEHRESFKYLHSHRVNFKAFFKSANLVLPETKRRMMENSSYFLVRNHLLFVRSCYSITPCIFERRVRLVVGGRIVLKHWLINR